ncbi:MAG: hypothetical protein ABR501_09725 [Pyrinomonadaceae bacterium]
MFVGAAIGVIGKKLMHDYIVTIVGILLSLAGMFLRSFHIFLRPERGLTHLRLDNLTFLNVRNRLSA